MTAVPHAFLLDAALGKRSEQQADTKPSREGKLTDPVLSRLREGRDAALCGEAGPRLDTSNEDALRELLFDKDT